MTAKPKWIFYNEILEILIDQNVKSLDPYFTTHYDIANGCWNYVGTPRVNTFIGIDTIDIFFVWIVVFASVSCYL